MIHQLLKKKAEASFRKVVSKSVNLSYSSDRDHLRRRAHDHLQQYLTR